MELALGNMRVLDVTHHIAGPYCTKLLADFGADVIKIERPGQGDSSRHMGPFPGDVPDPEKSGLFLHLNTNKRSVTLNLKSRTGQDIFKELAKKASVVVESFRPGVMPSLGLDYPTLSKSNPDLVMASISNFGQTGPYRDYKASDLVLAGLGGDQARGGVSDREPLKLAQGVTQYMGGLYAASGILGAFFASKWQGIGGQYLDLSLMELLGNYSDGRGPSQVRYQFNGKEEVRPPLAGRAIGYPPSGAYPCQDGYVEWFGSARWTQIARMLKRPDFVSDPRYSTPEARIQNFDDVNATLLEWMMQRTKEQCVEEALAADAIAAQCNTIAELFEDTHVKSRGFWADIVHPAVGKTVIPGRPFIMNQSPWRLRRPAPLLGEHTAEVLGDLGYTGADLVKLSEAGVI